jgi:hypothetical protein
MKKLVAWVKSIKWLAYAVLAVSFGVLLLILRNLFFGPKPKGPERLPDVPPKLREKVEKAEEAALRAKVEANVTAEAEKKAVEEILKIDDGKERRRRLAEKLRNL